MHKRIVEAWRDMRRACRELKNLQRRLSNLSNLMQYGDRRVINEGPLPGVGERRHPSSNLMAIIDRRRTQ